MDAYNHGNPGSVREQRLNYFMENYLPKNEVLYRLPLNIQIEPFWAELSNRRKAGAVLLPLENAAGMPYWFTLTKKMVAASTRLCEEALNCTEAFDPFRMKMTSAMTQEMYFTSYVEGAQISLEDSLDFLGSGAEPSNIGEQMVWNNRQAWTQMCQNLYRPMHEDYLKYLAWCLTDGMENCADDYRQTDTHPIAAMGGESYSVPPAYRIPDMMQRYAAFLMDPDVHPLVKASAGAAYLLVTRPFPEGNERLSRMVPAAILFRSGYPFFKDISLSGVIAKENYLYYKGMCDIIRDGGDLTYFMEYFLEMLVRALDQMDDRKRKKQEEEEKGLAEQERQMAVIPLGGSIRPADGDISPENMGDSNASDNPEGNVAPSKTKQTENAVHDPPSDTVVPGNNSPGMGKFAEMLQEASDREGETISRVVPFIRKCMEQNATVFNRRSIEDFCGLTESKATKSLIRLIVNGLAEKIPSPNKRFTTYRLMYEPDRTAVLEPPYSTDSGEMHLQEDSPGTGTHGRVQTQGRDEDPFSYLGACGHTKLKSFEKLADAIRWTEDWLQGSTSGYVPEKVRARLMELLEEQSVKNLRVAAYICRCFQGDDRKFTSQDYAMAFKIGESTFNEDLRRAREYGLIRMWGKKRTFIYEALEDPAPVDRRRKMTDAQEEMLHAIIQAFGEAEFQKSDCMEKLGWTESTAEYYLGMLSKRGGLYADKSGKTIRYRCAGQEDQQADLGRREAEGKDQSDEAEAMRDRLQKHAGSDPDFAEYWTLPGEEDKTQMPAATAG